MKLGNNKFCYLSLIIYLFLILKENVYLILPYNISNYVRKMNIYLLVFVYLYETFIMFIFNKSILLNWKKKDYVEHHVISSIGMICVLYNDIPLHYFANMQKYVILINIIELTRVLQNWNIQNKYIYFNFALALYYLLNLIYYEIYDSYIYFMQEDTKNKSIIIYPILFALYHSFIVLPILIKKQIPLYDLLIKY